MLATFRSGFKGSNGKDKQIELVRADMNHFGRHRAGHEWVACGFREWSVLYYKSQGDQPCSAPNINLSMDSYHTTTFFFKNGSTVEFRTGSVTFVDGLNLTTAMIANDALLEAMADYLSKQDADTLARFAHLFSPAVLEAQA